MSPLEGFWYMAVYLKIGKFDGKTFVSIGKERIRNHLIACKKGVVEGCYLVSKTSITKAKR
jgi:hypothetical protein